MLALWALIFRTPRIFRPFLILIFGLFFLAVAYHSAMQLRLSLERSHHARSLSH
jgi:hypothetical protein